VIGTSEIISTLAEKYGLPMEKVNAAVGQVLHGKAFKHATSSDFGQITDDGVVVFRERGVSLLGELKHPLSRLLSDELEKILMDAATAVELEQWHRFYKQVVRARIERITTDGDIEVQLERNGVFGECTAEIIGKCSLRNQSPWDRHTLRCGETRYFYVQKVEARRSGTAPARISIELSRVTPRLVEYLIRKGLKGNKVSFKCVKRVVGKVSYIDSEGFIPNDVIKAAGKELGERVNVNDLSKQVLRRI